MAILATLLIYGVPGSLVLSALILAMLWHNPRLLLRDYPKDVRAAVPPKTPTEKRWSAYWAGVFLLLLIAFPMLTALSAKAAHQGFPGIFLSHSTPVKAMPDYTATPSMILWPEAVGTIRRNVKPDRSSRV